MSPNDHQVTTETMTNVSQLGCLNLVAMSYYAKDVVDILSIMTGDSTEISSHIASYRIQSYARLGVSMIDMLHLQMIHQSKTLLFVLIDNF